MEQGKASTKCGGIDVGKRWLDAAVHGLTGTVRVSNDAAGLARLVVWLRERGVVRVGLEATGGYERAACTAMQEADFEVVLHQPIEVRLFAKLKRLRAKNDRIDAVLIAAATAQADAVLAAQDARLIDLAERLTAYEQLCDQAAALKGFMEHNTLKDMAKLLRGQIRSLETCKAKIAADILRRIKAHGDLAERLALLMSLPGIGPIVGATLLVRMPELGRMKHGQAASLLGAAPFDRDSGQWSGQRHIAGGRRRPRRMLYLAALSARRWDPGLRAFAERLAQKGKAPKVVLVAIMRKLIEAANLVLARGTPWTKLQPT